MEQTGGESIEEVEHGAYDDECKCYAVVALKGKVSGDAARYEVAASQRVGYMLLHVVVLFYATTSWQVRAECGSSIVSVSVSLMA